mmetsp:Transcript_71044/g.230647  ORF Transcript_71044/g.230647 Transcript_71044/m.230647 type:complete len:515 (-) Transcript_71044:30-1574(-)
MRLRHAHRLRALRPAELERRTGSHAGPSTMRHRGKLHVAHAHRCRLLRLGHAPLRAVGGAGAAATSRQVAHAGLEDGVGGQTNYPAAIAVLVEGGGVASTKPSVGGVDLAPLRLHTGRPKLDAVACGEDHGAPGGQEHARGLGRHEHRPGQPRQARGAGLSHAATPGVEAGEARLLVVREGVDGTRDEPRDLGDAREVHGGVAATPRVRHRRAEGAVLREEPHELGLVGVEGQARDDDALAHSMAIEHQVQARHTRHLVMMVVVLVRPGRRHMRGGSREGQLEAGQHASMQLVHARHEHPKQSLPEPQAAAHGDEVAVGLDAEGDSVTGRQARLPARRPAKNRLALAEDCRKFVADDATDRARFLLGALLHWRRLHNGALELAQALDLLGLRVALYAQAHAEADEILLGECRRRRLVRHGGALRMDLACGAALRECKRGLGLGDVDVAPKFQGGLRTSHEAEAAAGIVGLHHAQELLSAKVVLRGLLLLRRHARGWRGGIHRHCGTQSLTQIRC